MRTALGLFMMIVWSCSYVSEARADDLSQGRSLAELNCMGCHAIEAAGDSPLQDAPPFRDIAVSYDAAELEDAFNEGVATDHPAMPDWQMTADEARQLAAYIISLRGAGKIKTEKSPVCCTKITRMSWQ